ncbi:MAG: DUF971 domain-containing protein [Candidatus Omnitrophica bacterium]|nr:DUF971 domain-containing protein [Candidatus Omnitrophota bacterium]
MENQRILRPLEIKQADSETLAIRWEDAHESRYPSRSLRLLCRCAACVDEWSGAHRLNEDSVPQDVHPVRLQSVGRYGIKIDWSDGHNTGIYTFQYLREICPCAACRKS